MFCFRFQLIYADLHDVCVNEQSEFNIFKFFEF